MNSNQAQKDNDHIDSSNSEEKKISEQKNAENTPFGETFNPVDEPTQITHYNQGINIQTRQPQDLCQNKVEETETQQPLKFSDFLSKNENHQLIMKIIQEGQNIQFEDDQNKFEPLNDGQIIAIQLYHYCVFDLQSKGNQQNSMSLINPVDIKWIETEKIAIEVNELFIKLQKLDLGEKFQDIPKDQLKSYQEIKVDILDYFNNILELFQQNNQNDTQLESQDEIIECFANEIATQLKSIDNIEIQKFLNQIIYKLVDELKLSSYFDGKLSKSTENVGQNEEILVKIPKNEEVIELNEQAESLILPLNQQEQAKVDRDIKSFLENPDDTEEEFIDYLLETYIKLQNIRPLVVDYLKSFKDAQSIISASFNSKDKLVKLKNFANKRKIIEWLK